ncbi:MAG: hypothetical protein A3H94_00685 [Acidobacteria bacterium RIFCSPLOWO2_02_FULL_60_20]|nr:MAG: hypothetical protein A3H94_00685 [Acidobacteria bacterium RIFCSPLOWO2_02_FULL_60_20]
MRLWFLGVDDYRKLEEKLSSNEQVYVAQMTRAVGEMFRVLKPDKFAVLVLGDYRRNGHSRDSATTIERIVLENYSTYGSVTKLLEDEVPDARRSRRRTRTTKLETILLIRKKA